MKVNRCLHPIPITVDKKNGRRVKISAPCGKCEFCLSKRKQLWTFRLCEEFKVCDTAYFVTLTYDDHHLPWYSVYSRPISGRDFYTYRRCERTDGPCVNGVSKIDVQKFLKRLRKSIQPFKIRYFLVSEYGPETLRPHYHMILFDFPQSLDIEKRLNDTWGLGFVSVSPLNEARISYTCKYVLNSLPLNSPLPKNFMLCSKGIGKSYLNDANISYHRSRLQPYLDFGDRVIPLPRYLVEKIFTYDEMDEFSKENEKRGLKDWYELHDKLSKMSSRDRQNYFVSFWTSQEDARRRIFKKSKKSTL